MRIAILALTLALAGCFQDTPSRLVGAWVSEKSGAKIKISEDGECRYYFDSNKGVGLVCKLAIVLAGIDAPSNAQRLAEYVQKRDNARAAA